MRSARIQCFYVFTLLLCPLTINAITEKEWSTVIDVSNFQEALVERMVKQFLLIVKGIDVKVTQENLRGTIDLFDSSSNNMKTGIARCTSLSYLTNCSSREPRMYRCNGT